MLCTDSLTLHSTATAAQLATSAITKQPPLPAGAPVCPTIPMAGRHWTPAGWKPRSHCHCCCCCCSCAWQGLSRCWGVCTVGNNAAAAAT